MTTLTIIFLILTFAYILILQALKDNATRNISLSINADSSCRIRQSYAFARILLIIIYATCLVFMLFNGNWKVSGICISTLLTWSAFQKKNNFPVYGRRPDDIKGAFVLYLRGFCQDNHDENPWDKKKSITGFSEGRFFYFMNQYLPCYAVGMPKELSAPHGARRIYVNEDTWYEEVVNLMQRASLIVILINSSNSCLKELISSKKYNKKVVYIADNTEQLQVARRKLSENFQFPIPATVRNSSLTYWDHNNNCQKVLHFTDVDKDYRSTVKQIWSDNYSLKRFCILPKTLRIITFFVCISVLLSTIIFNLIYDVKVSTILLLWFFIIVCIIIISRIVEICYYQHSDARINKR